MVQPQSLRYFAEVARSKSLRQASEVFYVAPSAISRQISNLEKEFGADLFERTPRGMVLTDAGRLLMEYVEQSEQRLRTVRDEIDGLGGLKHGVVNVALVEAVSFSFLPKLLVEFKSQFPHIFFNLRVCGTAEIVELVANHQADVGFAFNVLNRDDVILHGRLAQPLQVICAPNHPLAGRSKVSMGDLQPCRVALPDRSFGIRYLIEKAAAEAKVELEIEYEANSLQTLKNIVSQTDVVGFMPSLTFEYESKAGLLTGIMLDNRACTIATIDLVSPRNRKMPPAVAAFMGFIRPRFTHRTPER